MILRCKYKNENNFILIFGYKPNRHNRLISDLFGRNFLWLHLTSSFIPYMITSEKNKYLVFKFLEYLLLNFSNVKKVDYFNEYFCDLWNVESFPEKKKICLEPIVKYMNLYTKTKAICPMTKIF